MPNTKGVTLLKQERAEHLDAADEILARCKTENREPNTLEKRAFDKKMAAVDRIDKYDLPAAEKRYAMANRQNRAGQPEPELDSMGLGSDYANTSIVGLGRHQPVRHFRGVVNGKPPAERACEFGHWILGSLTRQIPGRFQFTNSIAICEERGLNIYNVASTSDNSNAGVLVPGQFGQDIVFNREEFGIARGLAEVLPMTSDTRTDPKWTSGLTANFVDENDAAPESDANWENIKLVAKDLVVLTRMSAQLSADAAISYGDLLMKEITRAMANAEDRVMLNGTGVSTDAGIIGIRTRLQDVDGGGTDSFGLFTQGAGSTWGAIVIGDFHDTMALAPQYALERDPAWVCSVNFYHSVMTPLAIAQAGGATIGQVAQVAGATTNASFLGYPVLFSTLFPTTTATTSLVCTFGSHTSGIRMGDRQQESILFSEHASVGGQSVFERNQIAVRGTTRLDIVVHGYGTSAAAGPIVGLQTGA